MPTIRVEIDWDNDDPHWLNADNVHMCLQSYCKNTKFEVREVGGVGDHLSASEALFGFVGWLTTRPEETIMSGRHDAGKPADRIGEFMKANQLSEPRDGWQHKLVWVEEVEVPRDLKWRFYNLAFRLLGNTRWWPVLGWKIWN